MLTAVVQKVDNAFQCINQYHLDSAIIGSLNTYPLDSDLSDDIRHSAIHCLSNQDL